MANEAAAQVAPAEKAAVDPKAAAVSTNAAPKPEATRIIKVSGKERKVTEAEYHALAQKGAFADDQLKSVDVLKKSTAALLEKLKTDPLAVLTDPSLGLSRDQILDKILAMDASDATKERLSKWVYEKVVQTAKMTPEELAREQKLAEYETLKKQDEDRKKQQVTEQEKQQVQQVYTAVRAEVVKQIVADKTFPQTEGSISAVINTLRAMNKKGAQITAENVTKALEKVKKDHILNQHAILDADKEAPDYGEKLISRIGEERALAVSRALVARLKAKNKIEAKEKGKENLREVLSKKLNVLPSGHTVMEW